MNAEQLRQIADLIGTLEDQVNDSNAVVAIETATVVDASDNALGSLTRNGIEYEFTQR